MKLFNIFKKNKKQEIEIIRFENKIQKLTYKIIKDIEVYTLNKLAKYKPKPKYGGYIIKKNKKIIYLDLHMNSYSDIIGELVTNNERWNKIFILKKSNFDHIKINYGQIYYNIFNYESIEEAIWSMKNDIDNFLNRK